MKSLIRISVKKNEMTTHKVTKTKFSQLNDKMFYFPNAILCLPFGHTALKQLDKYKKKKGQKVESYFTKKKRKTVGIREMCP